MLKAITEDFGNGGTIDGDVTITGDLTVSGGGSLSFDEILEGTQVIDVTDTEAFLVRKNSDGGNVFVVDSTNTRVGIATDSPDGTLHSHSGSAGSVSASAGALEGVFENSGDAGITLLSPDASFTNVIFGSASDSIGAQLKWKHDSDLFRIGTANAGASLAFETANTVEAMRIDSSGNLLMGHAASMNSGGNTPKLQVSNNNNDAAIGVYNYGNNAAHFASLRLAHSKNGTIGSHTVLADNDKIGIIEFNGSDGTNFDTIGARIIAEVDGSPTSNRMPSALIFSTAAGGSDDDVTERMRIMSNGNVGIGGTPNGEANLLVHSGDQYASQIYITNTDTGIGDSVGFVIGLENDEGAKINKLGSGSYLRLGTNGVHRMILDDNSRISLSNNDSGTDNTVFGFMAGAALASGGVENTLVGDYAGTAITTGDYNTAVGKNALPSEDVGQSSTAIGYSALGSQNTGSQSHVNNVGVGVNTGYYNGTGTNNTWLGSNAGVGASGQSNSSNVGVGANSMRVVSTGGENVSVGKDSMYDANTASGVVAVGTESAYNITSGSESVAIGKQALYTATTVGANTAVGYQALKLNTVASNTAVGHSAGFSSTGTLNCYFGASAGSGGSGAETNNIGIGASALLSVTSGSYNTVIGAYAGDALTTTNNCTLIGRAAGSGINSTDANETVCVGNDSGEALTSAQHTTAIGYKALGGNSTGDNNTALGHQALLTCTGGNNTAIGQGAMVDLVEGTDNVAVGKGAFGGALNTDADASVGNVFMGKDAGGGGWTSPVSNYNVGIGMQSMDAAMAGALYNVGLGYVTLSSLTSGDHNTALGTGAGAAINTGSNNTIVGSGAGDLITDTSSTVIIGYQAGDAINSTDADGTVLVGYFAGSGLTSAIGVTSVGYQSGKALTTGGYSTFLGYNAGLVHTTGGYNMAIGYGAMNDTDAGSNSLGSTENIFIGVDSGGGTWADTSSSNNVAVGNYTMDAALDGAIDNVAFGKHALGALTTGDRNTALGTNAGFTSVDVDKTVLIGYNAGAGGNMTSDADGTIAIGEHAGYALTTGSQNLALGFQAMLTQTTGHSNVAIGYESQRLANNNAADGNVSVGNFTLDGFGDVALASTTAIGHAALSSALTSDASGSTAVGRNALNSLTSGQRSTAVGYYALANCDDGDNNTAIGWESLEANAGDSNTAVGAQSLKACTGGLNTTLGYQAATALVSGTSNTIVGGRAFYAADGSETNNTILGTDAGNAINHDSTDGNVIIGHDAGTGGGAAMIQNVVIGRNALNSTGNNTTTGIVAIGYSALTAQTSGTANTAIGFNALSSEDAGSNSTAVGYSALSAQNNDTGHNTAVGWTAGDLIVGGYSNVLIGSEAGTTGTNDLVGGYQNVLIGQAVAASSASAVNQIVIGRGAVGQGDNTVTLGNASVTAVYMGQDSGARIFAERLDLKRPAEACTLRMSTFDTAADTASTIYLETSNHDTADNYAAVDANDILGQVYFNGSDGDSSESGGWIRCTAAETWDADSRGTTFTLALVPSGADSTTLTTRIAIDGSGELSADLNDTSDVNLKENVKTINDGLSIVKQINPVTFDWKEKSKGSNSGFIAQEIEKLLPNDVSGEDYITPKDGEQAENMGKSINVTGIVAHLVKAVQELTAKVEALEKK
ncbi:glycoprotein repeat domain-containing protein [uncultured Mediterranean phage]|nr:glycoprotein repeat domain-containing protein [uncultured Mediterranean phage]